MFDDFLSLLFPHTCEICRNGLSKGEYLLCVKCISQLPKNDNQILKDEMYKYFIRPERYKGFYSYLKYYKKGIARQLLHKIKYRKLPVLGEMLGYWLGLEIKAQIQDKFFDLIIPVPLHPEKRRKRGFNQSDHIAMGLSKALTVKWTDKYVIRIINNVSQTNKGRMERLENVERIFKVINHREIQAYNILLVDDVITTGATLESCADELIRAGIGSISFATLAIARY